MENKKLPTLKELFGLDLSEDDKVNAVNVLLNQDPPDKWIKRNKFAGNSEYLPIDKVEYLLTKIFKDWFVKIKNIQQIGNSVECTLTLYYKPVEDKLLIDLNYFANLSKDNKLSELDEKVYLELQKIYYTRKKEDWYNKQDGTGAAAIQVDAGEKASAFDKIKPYGVAIAAPKAESIALSDAADKIGRVFGKDLNRETLVSYDGLIDKKKFENAKITEK